MRQNIKIIIFVLAMMIMIFIFGVAYWTMYLKFAHSSFENYYSFRECVQLINKTENYGYCKTESGDIIKIVKYKEKWYLDGDLPTKCFLFECP